MLPHSPWILLDGSGVLFSMHHQKRLQALAVRSAPHVTVEYIDQIIWKSGLDNLFDMGYFTENDILAELQKHLGYTGTLTELRQDWCVGFELRSDLLDLQQKIIPQAHLAILSDNGPLLFHALPTYFPQLSARVEQIFFSCELRLCKPAPEVFHTVLRQLQCPAHHILFVDDLRSNCRAAHLLGFQTHTYTTLAEFKNRLQLFSSHIGTFLPI